MSIKKYFANADNTITNAYRSDLQTRGTASNMGLSDILEVFSIYGQQGTASSELSRALINFPITDIITDRTNKLIPANGSVSFYLKMYNAPHGQTLPKNYDMSILAVSSSWVEGDGLDMESYSDLGVSNWISGSTAGAWTTAGGDYHASPAYSQTFVAGTEDIEIDVTSVVEEWIAGTKGKYGFGIQLTGSLESDTNSYYTKKFFARGSEFFFKRPTLEARWESSEKDDRGNFYYSSSLAPAADNMNTLYLYNYVRGQLVNIPAVGTGEILVSLYSGSTAPTGSKLVLYDGETNITGGYVSTGIYTASVAITASSSPLEALYDVWHSGGTEYKTGSITPKTLTTAESNPSQKYVTNISNLKPEYTRDETARFRVYIREKDWSPTIYTVAKNTVETTVIESGSYEVYRVIDDLKVLPHGTGSILHSLMSYDVSGNYFDLDMSLLEDGYAYGIKFAYYNGSLQTWVDQPESFKFRVNTRQKN